MLDRARFNSKISTLFSNYLINKKTQYTWRNFVSPTFRADVDIVGNTKIRLYLIFFSFLFLFFQSILFLELELGISGISQVMVTLSHDHVP